MYASCCVVCSLNDNQNYTYLLGMTKAHGHIPPKTAFVWAIQLEKKVHKQDEIDMPNAKPILILANATIFHLLGLGFTLDRLAFALGWLGSR